MPRPKALVLDDDKDVCEIIAAILQEEDCEVTVLTDVDELRSLARLDGFDFAVVDMVMVGSSGGWHIDRIIAAGIPAIFVSGYLGYMELRQPPPAGYPFLQKPFAAADLLDKVKSLLAEPRRTETGRAG
jgi:DNA-binding NtrC family response regulator